MAVAQARGFDHDRKPDVEFFQPFTQLRRIRARGFYMNEPGTRDVIELQNAAGDHFVLGEHPRVGVVRVLVRVLVELPAAGTRDYGE